VVECGRHLILREKIHAEIDKNENSLIISWNMVLLYYFCFGVQFRTSYHVCGHKFESRLERKASNFPHHLRLLLGDYRGMAKFGAHFNQEVRFNSAVKCEGPEVLYSVRGLERSELGGSHGCPGRLWDRVL